MRLFQRYTQTASEQPPVSPTAPQPRRTPRRQLAWACADTEGVTVEIGGVEHFERYAVSSATERVA